MSINIEHYHKIIKYKQKYCYKKPIANYSDIYRWNITSLFLLVNTERISGENQEMKKKWATIPMLFPRKILHVNITNKITDQI
jgi:hypothetical protein